MKKKLYFLLFFLIVILIFANLVASNRLSTDGEQIKALEKEIESLDSENLSLELKIASTSSIPSVISRAESLGFVHSPNVFHLRGEIPVAMR